jgi:hypothetical protein
MCDAYANFIPYAVTHLHARRRGAIYQGVALSTEFEDQYLDVLQNIETVLAQLYHQRAEMNDHDAHEGIHALLRAYQAEARGKKPPAIKLTPLAQKASDDVKALCEWRLGRSQPLDPQLKSLTAVMQPHTVDEICECLKRIRRSIEMWNKEGGRRGYFNFVSQFLR